MRDRFRSTRLHNTVTVDGRSSSVPAGPFHWAAATGATRLAWRSTPELDLVEAAHDGYHPVRHVRRITARPGCWIVDDHIEGEGDHRIDVFWHLDPAWTAEHVEGGLVRVRHRDGARVWIRGAPAGFAIVTGGADEGELGWVSPVYGATMPSTTLRLGLVATLPVRIATIVTDSSEPPPEPGAVSRPCSSPASRTSAVQETRVNR